MSPSTDFKSVASADSATAPSPILYPKRAWRQGIKPWSNGKKLDFTSRTQDIQLLFIHAVLFIKMDPKIAHLILHALIFYPDLDHINMLEAAFLNRLVHLAEQQGCSPHPAIFFHQAHAVDIEPFGPPQFNQKLRPTERKKFAARALDCRRNIRIGK